VVHVSFWTMEREETWAVGRYEAEENGEAGRDEKALEQQLGICNDPVGESHLVWDRSPLRSSDPSSIDRSRHGL
jgi:hypothetical protein